MEFSKSVVSADTDRFIQVYMHVALEGMCGHNENKKSSTATQATGREVEGITLCHFSCPYHFTLSQRTETPKNHLKTKVQIILHCTIA